MEDLLLRVIYDNKLLGTIFRMRHPTVLVEGAKMTINMLEFEGFVGQLNSRGDLLLPFKAQIREILVPEY